jgi:hypothetical protein
MAGMRVSPHRFILDSASVATVDVHRFSEMIADRLQLRYQNIIDESRFAATAFASKLLCPEIL